MNCSSIGHPAAIGPTRTQADAGTTPPGCGVGANNGAAVLLASARSMFVVNRVVSA
jgi:hypothetical protein